MQVSRIHYITQNIPGVSHQRLAYEACAAGADLVQLRIKEMERPEILRIAMETKVVCRHFKAALVINDYLDVAIQIDADGVHLGNDDVDHQIARKELGKNKIIGATAYNVNEVLFHQMAATADYIGLGTFRQTRTKPDIKDFLTLEQIKELIARQKQNFENPIPLLVIGGIRLSDIQPLLSVGVYGIAIASLVNESDNKTQILNAVKEEFRSAGLNMV